MIRTERGERAVTRTMSIPAACAASSAVRDRVETVPSVRSSVPSRSIAARRAGDVTAPRAPARPRGCRPARGGYPAHASSSDTSTIAVPRQRDHPAEPAGRGEVGRGDAEPRPEHAVGGRRGAAALKVAEHRHAGLEPRQLLEPCSDEHRHASETLEAERVDRRGDGLSRPVARCPPRRRRRSSACRRSLACARRRRRPRGRTAPRARGSRPLRPRCPRTSRSSPRVRPITSTSITRSCDSAVVVMRSIASVAICTAVSKPKVTSVAAMSLSIVFGTPTIGTPLRREPERRAERAVAADHDHRVDPLALERRGHRRGALAVDVRVAPRRAENRAATLEDAAHRVAVERAKLPLHEAVPPVEDPDDLGAVPPCRARRHAADHGVQPGTVAARGQDRNPLHARNRMAAAAPRSTVLRTEGSCDRDSGRLQGCAPPKAGIEPRDSAPAESRPASVSTGTSACRRRGAPWAGSRGRRTARRRRPA